MITEEQFISLSWAQRYLFYHELKECWWTKEKASLQEHIAALFDLPSYTQQKGIQYDGNLFHKNRKMGGAQ
jgi:hypothetical protein